MVKIVIQQNSENKNYQRSFFPKNSHTLYLNISHPCLIHFFPKN